MDDPAVREKIVGEAVKEAQAELNQKLAAERAEKSRIRGSGLTDQIGEIKKRNIETWEDAEADGLIDKDERGRWAGGMRQALNISINGTEKLKQAVAEGRISGEVAEELLSLAYMEAGGEARQPEIGQPDIGGGTASGQQQVWGASQPVSKRAAFIDKVVDLADGNADMAREIVRKLREELGISNLKSQISEGDARVSDGDLLKRVERIADEVAAKEAGAEARQPEIGGETASGRQQVGATKQPETAYEGAVNAERMKGTELKSGDGASLTCERFPDVKITISEEGITVDGLTDMMMSQPENQADVAALLKRLSDIAERNGLTIDLGDKNAETVALGLIDEVNRGGVAAAQRKMDTRSRLFQVLGETTLGNGITFDEAAFKKALAETPNGRQFTDNHGNIYGFVDGEGVLHFNPTVFNLNTPIHEYGHLALEAVKKVNNTLWQRGIDLVKESAYYKEVVEEAKDANSPYHNMDETALRDEALARMIGDRGEKLVTERGLEGKLKEWLKELWKAFKGAMGVADLTEEQIEKMSLGEFVDVINAELLKGGEFGSRRAKSVEARSIKRYDTDQESGSNGLLRWKNDRGYLFKIPVDWERTRPGGKVFLATDDANITDWIQSRLNGYELRLSKGGRLYVKGHEGLPKELAEIFGYRPTIGQNDGIYRQIADAIGAGESFAEMTPDRLVAMLMSDRENYENWRAGRGAEAIHYEELAAQEAAEAKQRWEASGFTFVDYVKSRIEDGAPEFDLDWETMREIERDRAEGLFATARQQADDSKARFAVGRVNGKNTAIATGYPLTLREARDPKKVESVLEPFVGREFDQEGETKSVKVSRAFVDEFIRGKYGKSLISGKGRDAKTLMRARVGGASVIDDLIATTKLGTREAPKHLNRLFKDGATFYRSKTQFGIAVEGGVNVYPCELLILQTKDEKRYVYDFVRIGKPTLAASDTLDSDTLALVNARMPTVGVGSPMAHSIPNSGAEGKGENAKFAIGRGRQANYNKEELKKNIELATNTDRAKGPIARSRQVVEFSNTPQALIEVGAPDVRIISKVDTVRKLNKKHGLSVDQISDLPIGYSSPVAVFKNGNDFVVLTDIQAKTVAGRKKPVMVYLKASTKDGEHTFLASAYPREKATETEYVKLAKEGKLVFLDKERAALCGLEDETLFQLRPHSQSGSSRNSISNSGAEGNGENARFATGRRQADDNKGRIGPSKLGDGKQKYYEVEFDKAVDKIVKNGKPIGNDYVYVTETPEVFAKIGLAKLPFMMTQKHVLTTYNDAAALEKLGIKGNAHDLKKLLKQVPKAIHNPLMIIASETNPSTSIVAITRMRDTKGHTVIVPVALDGIAEVGDGSSRIDARIMTSAYGKGNTWSKLVENAITNENNGSASIFYVDTEKASEIDNLLAKSGGRARLAMVKTTRKGSSVTGYARVQFPRGRQYANPVHSISDPGSPVKGVISDQTQTRQFKEWFAKSKLVDENGKPRVFWHGGRNGNDFTVFDGEKSPNGFHFAPDARRHSAAGYYGHGNERPFYLSIQNPLVCKPGEKPNIEKAKSEGYDGIIVVSDKSAESKYYNHSSGKVETEKISNGDIVEVVAFRPEQIKSATDNIGTFDLTNPDVRFQVGGERAESGRGSRRGRRPPQEWPAREQGTPATPRNIINKALFVAGRARVAGGVGGRGGPQPRDWGEQSPGALAASRELNDQIAAPMSMTGDFRKMSLPLPMLEFLRKRITGNEAASHVVGGGRGSGRGGPQPRDRGATASGQQQGGGAGRQLYILADVFGTVDRTDMAKEKGALKQHGFFRNEDPDWCAGQMPPQIIAEKKRSEDQLARQLLALGSRRVRGTEPGGQEVARKVFADEVAKMVLDMPVKAPGVLGQMQTIGKALRKEVVRRYGSAGAEAGGDAGHPKNGQPENGQPENAGTEARNPENGNPENTAKAEAAAFIEWAYGGQGSGRGGPQPQDWGGPQAREWQARDLSLEQLSDAMFGAWLVMPREVEARAAKWSECFEATVANDPRLREAFKEMTRIGSTDQATGYLMQKLERQMSLETERRINRLVYESREPIGAGSRTADAKEALLVSFHDKFAPVYVRVDEKVKGYVKAKRELLKKTRDPATRAAIQQEIDLFTGDVGQKMHKLELSRTAYERGAWNEGRKYFMEMLMLENKAAERWGLSEKDRSLYLQLQRVIETQGRAASFGMTARNAQLGLDQMKARLGAAKWTKLEQYGNEFFDIHERNLLDDPRAEAAFGADYIKYLKTQVHYTTTKRTWSPEELDQIERGRAMAKEAGAEAGGDAGHPKNGQPKNGNPENGDDMISQVYAFVSGHGGPQAQDWGAGAWTARLKGSMAATQEVRSATWEKVDRLQKFLRRNQLVRDLKVALLAANVDGVRDFEAGSKGIVGPDGPRYGHLTYMENGKKRVLIVPKQIADAFKTDADGARWITKANELHRAAIIDYNPAYWAQNVKRNQDSVEKNMPGMRETYLKTGLRAVAPGVSPVVDLVSQALVRKFPKSAALFGENTVFKWIPTAERYARILEDPSGWQKELWEAEDAGDIGAVTRMRADLRGTMEMLRGNFLVPGRAAYRGAETDGFAFDMMGRKGLRMLEQIEKENAARTKGGKFVDAINVFKKNQAQQEHEDILIKAVAYLHDRAAYGLVRSVEESGLTVKKNVSIAEGERSGRLKRPVQQFMAQFFNMVEKGVVRHWAAWGERPGEMAVKDGKVWVGRLVGSLFASGVIAKFMLDDSDGDEEKARAKYGMAYDYAKACNAAHRNCSNYVKENYNVTPIWTSPDGMTSVVIGGAMTDEDKLIAPSADLVAAAIANGMGIGKDVDFGKAIANSTFKAVTPDLQLASPLVNFLRSTVEATMIDNPTDYFRNAPMYDQRLWAVRNEGWEMRGKFAAQVGAKLWNDFGGRSILAADVNGVDNGRGSAPDSLETVLKKIPVVSPMIARMIKIQVGSPEKQGEAITEEAKRKRNLIGLLAEDLLKKGDRDLGWHETDPQAFAAKLNEWREKYEFNDLDVAKLRAKYFNAWNQRRCRAAYDQKKLNALMREGRKQGLTEEQIWLQLGER